MAATAAVRWWAIWILDFTKVCAHAQCDCSSPAACCDPLDILHPIERYRPSHSQRSSVCPFNGYVGLPACSLAGPLAGGRALFTLFRMSVTINLAKSRIIVVSDRDYISSMPLALVSSFNSRPFHVESVKKSIAIRSPRQFVMIGAATARHH